MTETTWKEVRAAAAAAFDVRGDVQRKGGWNADEAEQQAKRLQTVCNLPDEVTAYRALLEILLMGEHFEFSETLTPGARFELVEIMWLRDWTGDEVRAAIPDVTARLHAQPQTLQRAVQILLEIGYRYRGMLQPDRWPDRAARGTCAELMWLSARSENDVYQAAREAAQRFELPRGHDAKAVAALLEIEVIYRTTAFSPSLEEAERRRLAEIMWLRGWTLTQALEQAVHIRASLGINQIPHIVDALHQICLRCGGPVVGVAVERAVDAIVRRTEISAEQRELLQTQFGEFRWLQRTNTAQALEKIKRYAHMTDTPLRTVFTASLEAARNAYRERDVHKE